VQRAVAADADQRLDTLGLERREHRVHAAVRPVRVVARRAEERPADREDVADVLARHRLGRTVDDTLPPVAEADDRVPVLALAALHDRTDRRVEARHVAATGEQSDSHAEHSFVV